MQIEDASTIRTDRSVYDEILVTVQPAALLRTESLAGVRSDPMVPTEWVGLAILNADGVLPLEILKLVVTSEPFALENISAIRVDNRIQEESLTTTQSNATARTESLAGVRSDIPAMVEWRAIIVLNADDILPMEILGTVAVSGPMVQEFIRIVSSDSVIRSEWLLRLTRDASVNVEDLRITTVNADGSLAIEWLVKARGFTADGVICIEIMDRAYVPIIGKAIASERLITMVATDAKSLTTITTDIKQIGADTSATSLVTVTTDIKQLGVADDIKPRY